MTNSLASRPSLCPPSKSSSPICPSSFLSLHYTTNEVKRNEQGTRMQQAMKSTSDERSLTPLITHRA